MSLQSERIKIKPSVQNESNFQTPSLLLSEGQVTVSAVQQHRCITAESWLSRMWLMRGLCLIELMKSNTHCVTLCWGFSCVHLWTACLVEPSRTSSADTQIKLELLLGFILRPFCDCEAAVLPIIPNMKCGESRKKQHVGWLQLGEGQTLTQLCSNRSCAYLLFETVVLILALVVLTPSAWGLCINILFGHDQQSGGEQKGGRQGDSPLIDLDSRSLLRDDNSLLLPF